MYQQTRLTLTNSMHDSEKIDTDNFYTEANYNRSHCLWKTFYVYPTILLETYK